ncbi:MAG: FecR domain-containing protein [Gemmatimonadota bacterium]|nr:FecR domain-containing protein [Gemmatimonadota bacterium]
MPHSEETKREAGLAARHGAATHIQAATTHTTPIIPIVIGVIAVVAIGVFLLNDPNKQEREFGKAVESADARGLGSARGQRGALTLADSTAVKLAPETQIKVPPGFNAQVHGVSVNGAVQLTVKPITGEKALPFRVRARKVSITSTGGVLLVRAYDDDPAVYVMAKDGALTVRPSVDEKASSTLAAGQSMAIANDGTTKMLTPAEASGEFSWVDGNYTLNAVPLSGVLPVLQRWYNTQARINDPALLTRPVSAVLKLDSSKEALDAIGMAANVHIVYVGDTLTLADGAPNASNKVPAKAPKKKGK